MIGGILALNKMLQSAMLSRGCLYGSARGSSVSHVESNQAQISRTILITWATNLFNLWCHILSSNFRCCYPDELSIPLSQGVGQFHAAVLTLVSALARAISRSTNQSPQRLGSNSKLVCYRSPTVHGPGQNSAGAWTNGHGARVAAIKKHPVPGAKFGKCLEH